MKKGFVLILLFGVSLMQLFASNAETLFAEGNEAYKAKDYNKAIEHYDRLVSEGYKSADLEYNLGNAWYRQGSIGRAILHYERALILDNKHEATAKNLVFVRSKVNTEIEPLPDFFLTKWWASARMALGTTSMGSVAVLLWWAGFGALAISLLSKSKKQKKWGLLGGFSLLLISVLPFALAFSRSAYERNTKQAILVQKTAILRSAPEDASQEVMTIPEGTKLHQLTRQEGWWQVSLENGEMGWLPEQAMVRI